MADPATTAQLRVGPPPAGYQGGPVEVVYHPDDGRDPTPIQTRDTLDDAIAFANDCVDRGYLAGDLELRAATSGPSALEQQVQAEQAEYEAGAPGAETLADAMHQVADLDDAELGRIASSPDHPLCAAADAELERRADQPIDVNDAAAPEPEKPKRGRKPKPNTELEPTLAIVYINKNDVEKTDYEGPESTARAKFTSTPRPGVGRMELRTSDGTVLDVKAPHLSSVDPAASVIELAAEPGASGSASTQVENPEEAPAGIADVVEVAQRTAAALTAPPAAEGPEEPQQIEEDLVDHEREADEGRWTSDHDRRLARLDPLTGDGSGEALPPIEGDGTQERSSPPTAEGPEEPTGQKTLIDRTQYDREDLALPLIDGQQVDRIAFSFTGQIMLDRADPADVALWRKLTLGQDVTLQIEGNCAGYAGKGATNRDGDLDVVIGVRRIKVHTIYLPTGEAA